MARRFYGLRPALSDIDASESKDERLRDGRTATSDDDRSPADGGPAGFDTADERAADRADDPSPIEDEADFSRQGRPDVGASWLAARRRSLAAMQTSALRERTVGAPESEFAASEDDDEVQPGPGRGPMDGVSVVGAAVDVEATLENDGPLAGDDEDSIEPPLEVDDDADDSDAPTLSALLGAGPLRTEPSPSATFDAVELTDDADFDIGEPFDVDPPDDGAIVPNEFDDAYASPIGSVEDDAFRTALEPEPEPVEPLVDRSADEKVPSGAAEDQSVDDEVEALDEADVQPTTEKRSPPVRRLATTVETDAAPLNPSEAAALAQASLAQARGPIGRGPTPSEPPAAAGSADRSEADADRQAFIEENSFGALIYGARATLGRMDMKAIERDLRIKARYLTAIERVDPKDLPPDAYLAGYVRAYATYLRDELPLSPDEAWEKFQKELTALRAASEPSGEATSDEAAQDESSIAAAAVVGKEGAQPSGPVKGRKLADQAEAMRRAAARARAAEGGDGDGPRRAPSRRFAPLSERLAARAADARASSDVSSTRALAAERAAGIRAARERTRLLREGGAPTHAPFRRPLLERLAPIAGFVALLGLVGAVGYGGWALFSAAQRVSAPSGDRSLAVIEAPAAREEGDVARPSADAYEEGGALVGAPLDGPILEVDPDEVGAFAGDAAIASDDLDAAADATADPPELEAPAPDEPAAADDAVAQQPPSDPVEAETPTDPAPADASSAVSEDGSPEQSPTEPAAADPERADAETAVAAAPIDDGDAAEAPIAEPPGGLVLVALSETWVRVRDASGETVFSGVMAPGRRIELPVDRAPYELRTGNAGGVALALDGRAFGPLGDVGAVQDVRFDATIDGLSALAPALEGAAVPVE